MNVPLFVAFSATLRRMSEAKLFGPESILLGSMCLSWPDPFVTAGMVVVNAGCLEIGRRMLPAATAGVVRWLGIIGHTLNVLSFWVLSAVPSSLAVFIGASNVLTLLENLVLKTRVMQRYLAKPVAVIKLPNS
jgi:hypothetical protein